MDAREQRRRRALSKPIKLLARNGLVFTVCGTTRETYTVTFDNRASCTCRDGRRVYGDIDHQCKHVLFILYKALDLNGSHIPTQTHFSPDDLQVITSSHVRGARGDVIKSVSPRMVDDQECPICLNTLDASCESVLYCKFQCGQCVHEACYEQYSAFTHTQVCILCRAPWVPGVYILISDA